MFTGIIEGVGTIASLDRNAQGGRLRIALSGAPRITAEMKRGDSIAVNGCCLTVIEFSTDHFSADLSAETLRRTSIGDRKEGKPVNLERPLMAGARLGGHFVQGHVDGVGHVKSIEPEGENWWLAVRVPSQLARYVAEKGSLAVEGISLTVARWQDGVASFAIIPFTYQHTNVGSLEPGDLVNLEVDILAKYVESLLTAKKPESVPEITVEELKQQGF